MPESFQIYRIGLLLLEVIMYLLQIPIWCNAVKSKYMYLPCCAWKDDKMLRNSLNT